MADRLSSGSRRTTCNEGEATRLAKTSSHGLRRLSFLAATILALLSAHADITGTVTLLGKPGSQDETFVAKANGCGESPVRHTENWTVGPKNELGDVAVWIVDPKIDKPINMQVMGAPVSQIGCRYVPHVTVVRAEMPFLIVNADPTLHNIRANISNGPGQPPGDTVFNFGQLRGGKNERSFDTPGIYTLACDVHAWMQCWVMVLPKAALPECATTDAGGSFKISNGDMLADGDYKIRAWHPRFADQLEQTIHVKNGTATANFQFDGAKSF